MFRVPLIQEIRAASELCAADGPQPISDQVDASPELSAMLGRLTAQLRDATGTPGAYTILKATLVAGLHLGIRIGEARNPDAGDQAAIRLLERVARKHLARSLGRDILVCASLYLEGDRTPGGTVDAFMEAWEAAQ